MTQELWILLASVSFMGFTHTLLGPDHYLPFIVMARSGKWSKTKTLLITSLCSIGHILGSVVLGVVGIGFGYSLTQLSAVESFRGDIAAWLLTTFGLLYFIWGMRKAFQMQNQALQSSNEAEHQQDILPQTSSKRLFTPWMLFVIFVLGPCEPLIPLMLYPAVKNDPFTLFLVLGTFALSTLVTMLTCVFLSFYSFKKLKTHKLERFTHAIAGATICMCGLGILLMGL